MTPTLAERIRAAHDEHVATVDPWAGAESVEKEHGAWHPAPTSAHVNVAPAVLPVDLYDPEFLGVVV